LPIAPSQPESSIAQTETNQTNQTNPAAESNTGNTNPPNTLAIGEQTAGPAAATPEITENNVTVAIKFNGRCWTQITIDGRTEYEGTPRVGDTLTFRGDQRILVRLGNAGAAEVTHNGNSIGRLGGLGEVVARTFTKDEATSIASQ
jgi:cytoskeletal protein RodZ